MQTTPCPSSRGCVQDLEMGADIYLVKSRKRRCLRFLVGAVVIEVVVLRTIKKPPVLCRKWWFWGWGESISIC